MSDRPKLESFPKIETFESEDKKAEVVVVNGHLYAKVEGVVQTLSWAIREKAVHALMERDENQAAFCAGWIGAIEAMRGWDEEMMLVYALQQPAAEKE